MQILYLINSIEKEITYVSQSTKIRLRRKFKEMHENIDKLIKFETHP
jgi:hypothetical protein